MKATNTLVQGLLNLCRMELVFICYPISAADDPQLMINGACPLS